MNPGAGGHPFRPLVLPRGIGHRVRGAAHWLDRKLRGSRIVEKAVPELGITYLLPTDTLLGRLIRLNGMYEEHIVNWITAHAAELGDGALIDVGANIGWYTGLFARLARDPSRVFAFEPDPTNCALAQRMAERNGLTGLHLINAAAGSESGIGTLNLSHRRYPSSHSMLSGQYSEGSITVPIVSIDDIVLPVIGDGPVALMKMDIEGYELRALAGARGVVARARYVIIEYSADLMRRAGLDPRLLAEIILSFGLAVQRFDSQAGLQPVSAEALRSGGLPQCDLLLSRRA